MDRQAGRVEVLGGALELEVEIALSADPRGGLFGYTDAVYALSAPWRDAVLMGAADGASEARARGALGPIDEVFLQAARIEGAPDPAELRDAVRAWIRRLAGA